MSKIGIIGDIHFKESLGYSDYIKDGRTKEKEEILEFIISSFSECDSVIFMGDQLNGRNNTSTVIKEFVSFLEAFNGKSIYIISGNHERFGNGKTAIDFLKEIKNENWHIMTDKYPSTKKVEGLNSVFIPYSYKNEFDCESNKEAAEKIMMLRRTEDIIEHIRKLTKAKPPYPSQVFLKGDALERLMAVDNPETVVEGKSSKRYFDVWVAIDRGITRQP